MKRYLVLWLSFLMLTLAQANPKDDVAYVDSKTHQAIFRLPENPTTGFRWFVTSAENPLIETIAYNYEAPSAAMPGKPGIANFVIKISAEAMTAPRIIPVLIKSARAWEPEVGQEKTLWVVVLAIN